MSGGSGTPAEAITARSCTAERGRTRCSATFNICAMPHVALDGAASSCGRGSVQLRQRLWVDGSAAGACAGTGARAGTGHGNSGGQGPIAPEWRCWSVMHSWCGHLAQPQCIYWSARACTPPAPAPSGPMTTAWQAILHHVQQLALGPPGGVGCRNGGLHAVCQHFLATGALGTWPCMCRLLVQVLLASVLLFRARSLRRQFAFQKLMQKCCCCGFV